MKTLRFVLATALLLLSGACDSTPTDPAAVAASGSPRPTTVGAPPFVMSIPDTLYADSETGMCDIPVKYVAGNIPLPANFDSGSVTAAGHKVEINGFWMRVLLGPITPNTTDVSVLEDAVIFESSPHLGAPYDGNLVVSWYMGGVKVWAILEFWCMPFVERPPVQNPPAPPVY